MKKLEFYCAQCGKRDTAFSGLSREDCPAQTVIRAGHDIKTSTRLKRVKA